MYLGECMESECPNCGYINLIDIEEDTDNWTYCEGCDYEYSATG